MERSNKEFRRILEENQGMVFSLALRIVRNREVAEEIAQDAFLGLYDVLETLANATHCRNWLRKTVTHRSIDWLRYRQSRPETVMAEEDLLLLPQSAAEDNPPDPWLLRQANQLIASLPAVPRAILVMHYQQELSAVEIGEALEMPVATVKSHLQRTLKLLREKAERSIR